MSETPNQGVRLNKYLASCGLGSRRGCETLIREGRVEINGKIITELSARVLSGDHVRCDGKRVQSQNELTLLFHKPEGCLCTKNDPQGRRTIYDVIPTKFEKLNYIGRLDYNSSGLILLTNSGDLNERLTHPRYHIEKEYHVLLDRPFNPDLTDKLLAGFQFEEGHARTDAVEIVGRKRLNLVLTQGYNRQIRRMFSKLDYQVRKLERFRIGSLVDYDLEPGKYRVMDSRMLEAVGKNP